MKVFPFRNVVDTDKQEETRMYKYYLSAAGAMGNGVPPASLAAGAMGNDILPASLVSRAS